MALINYYLFKADINELLLIMSTSCFLRLSILILYIVQVINLDL